MPTVSETTLAAVLPQGVPISFGVITPSFERLLGYVDASAAPVGSKIVWKLYAISAGVRSLAAVSDPISSGPNPYIVFDVPNEGGGFGVSMIAATTYEMVGIASVPGVVNIRAGFVGYDIEVNNPNEVSSSVQPLVFGTEVLFGTLANHHARVQVQFDALGVANVSGQARVYGTITGLAGPITALIAEGTLSNESRDPPIPISTMGLGFVTADLRIFAQNPSIGSGPVAGVLIGADVNLDIGGGGGGPPSGPAGGYLGGFYPNPTVIASPTLVFQPLGVASANIYNSWAALMGAFALTKGPVTIAIDDSLGVANVMLGVSDLQNRATLVAVNPKQSPQTTLNIPDGATIRNANGLDQLLRVLATPTTTPSFSFSPGVRVFFMKNGSGIVNHGTRALIDVAPASSVNIAMSDNSYYDNSLAPFPPFANLGAAGESFSITALTNSGLLGPTNTVTGVAGSSLVLQYDASWQGDPTLPGFFGALISRTVDAADFVFYSTANISPAPASLASQPSTQIAVDAHRSPVRTIAGNYVIDSAGFDGAIFSSVSGVNVTLPSAASWPGREITIKDTSVGAGIVFTLLSIGGNLIDGLASPSVFATPRGSLTVKSDGINTWWFI